MTDILQIRKMRLREVGRLQDHCLVEPLSVCFSRPCRLPREASLSEVRLVTYSPRKQ